MPSKNSFQNFYIFIQKSSNPHMGKKMKLPNFLSRNNNNTVLARSSSWPWPSCHQPRTLSFRTNNNIIVDNDKTDTSKMFKTINSAYNLDLLDDHHHQTTPESSWFTTTSDSAAASFSTASEKESRAVDSSVESVIKGLKSETERLFFEPGETSSILEEAKTGGFPFKKSLVLSMESQDPYIDFRKSMEEMVEAHGLKDWEDLEELLSWYLRVNGKSNHGYIVGAFVDLLIALAFASSPSSSTTTSSSSKINTATSICSSSSLASACSCSRSPSSPLSFYTSSSEDSSSTPCTVSLLEADEEEEEEIHTNNSSTNRCLSSLLEAEDEIKQKDDVSSSS